MEPYDDVHLDRAPYTEGAQVHLGVHVVASFLLKRVVVLPCDEGAVVVGHGGNEAAPGVQEVLHAYSSWDHREVVGSLGIVPVENPHVYRSK